MAGKNRAAAPDPIIDEETETLEFGEAEDLEDGASREGIGRRVGGHPADREHGLKTRVRSKAIVSGRPYAG